MPNIFFNEENFVLASPLIALCLTYGFFKIVPLKIGLPVLAFLSLMVQARAKIVASRRTDEHVDRTIVKDLVSADDALLARNEAKAEKKQRKIEQKLRERLKAERKKDTSTSGKLVGDDDDEGEMITKFGKGSRKSK